MKWKLKFFETGEWQVIDENLKDLSKRHVHWNPGRKNLFAALDAVPLDQVKVVILGQDPYPSHLHATGVAFSVPPSVKELPPTLKIIFNELVADLHCTYPSNGDLSAWCKQGVLLWNVVPSCTAGNSLSHAWPEWDYLNRELLEELKDKNVVFAALGSKAKEVLLKYVSFDDAPIVCVGHPSPRGNLNSKNPFTGSRLFSTLNQMLVKQGLKPIEWRLP